MRERVEREIDDFGMLLQVFQGVEPRVGIAALGDAGPEIMRERIEALFADVGILFEIEAAVEVRMRIVTRVGAMPKVMHERVEAGSGGARIVRDVEIDIEQFVRILLLGRASDEEVQDGTVLCPRQIVMSGAIVALIEEAAGTDLAAVLDPLAESVELSRARSRAKIFQQSADRLSHFDRGSQRSGQSPGPGFAKRFQRMTILRKLPAAATQILV